LWLFCFRGLVAYRRFSTQKQSRSGLGLEAQYDLIHGFAMRAQSTIVGEFVEVESGKNSNRTELRKAIAEAKRLKASWIIPKLARLSRNVSFISALMESGIDFFAADSPDDEPFIMHVKASFAKEEARKISERTKAALAVAKARGTKLGKPEKLTLAARIEGAGENRNLAVTAYALKSPLVKSLRTEGLSFGAIAERLNEKGYTTRTGSTWSAMQVKRVLDRNATYAN
jgi:DNA invertase Pin-like site-specific DNA recombinase